MIVEHLLNLELTDFVLSLQKICIVCTDTDEDIVVANKHNSLVPSLVTTTIYFSFSSAAINNT